MSHFAQNGNDYFPTSGNEFLLDHLPIGNFVVCASLVGLYFQRVQDFQPVKKLYGDFHSVADRVLGTFLDRPRATGVLFAGEKGCGKSELARLISLKGYDVGIPTILVNSVWFGDPFANLLQSVDQPAIVMLDEFEKVYDSTQQEALLTLLDGSMTSKKLFILTVNDKWKVNQNMKNRPGRLYYALDFDGLDATFVREYCEDNLKDQTHTESVVRVSSMFEKFNFDILKALIEEMNRYNENPFEALKMLNAKPVEYGDAGVRYSIKVTTPSGYEFEPQDVNPSATPLNSKGGEMSFYVNVPNEANVDDRDEDDEVYIQVNAADAKKIDAERGLFEFITDKGYRVVFERRKPKVFNPYDIVYD